jgi:uncharacterized SAM-binding protein YcdF (DUF218 family)
VLGSGLLLGAAALVGAGRLLVRADALDPAVLPADAIYVLGGARVDRWLEAVDIYRAGGAPRIVLSRGGTEPGEAVLAAQGIIVPNDATIGRAIMVDQLDLPASAIEILLEPVDNTAHEAEAIRTRVERDHWDHIIVITGRSATRRAGYAFERVLGDQVRITMRSSRHDEYDPIWWWRSRVSFRQTFYEVPKLLAYWLGLGP